MKDTVVRILDISLKNFKNVKKGSIKFKNYNNVKRDLPIEKGDIIGVYGQNGSGKTALVEALNIFKNCITGAKINKKAADLISVDESSFTMEIILYIESSLQKYLVNYEIEIRRDQNDNGVMVSKEKLSYSTYEEKWKTKVKLIEYSYDDSDLIKPQHRYKHLIKDKNSILRLSVAKELSRKMATSFLFSKETKEVFELDEAENHDLNTILKSIDHFGRFNLYVFTNEQLGIINMSQLQPFYFRLKENGSVISGGVKVKLFETSTIPDKVYYVIEKVIEQANIVLATIIPGLSLEIFVHDKQFLKENEAGVQIELISVRDQKKISLRNESDGIKKIISILSAIIAMYNQRNICLVVDELDSGVFEYLLGEILEVLGRGTQGQLIFTSHNLRALEKLDKESIVFTTANPMCRYIRLENVKSNNNLRDFYLRGISLGGQRETIYEETNTFEIEYAFKQAGRVSNEE